MAKILRVNMTNLTVGTPQAEGNYDGLGGRALTSALVNAEVPPTCHALSNRNVLVLARGMVSGTAVPCSGRLSVGAKSPLTGTIKESNAGGTAAQALAALGLDAVVVEGQPKENGAYVLVGSPSGWELVRDDSLRNKSNYPLVDKLFKRFGKKASIISIGKAGDMRLSSASVACTDPEGRPNRHAGRGGLGAVMGSKGLKAVVLLTRGAARPQPADPQKLADAAKRFVALLKEHPVTATALPTYGTNVLAGIVNAVGGYPTNNFSKGQFVGVDRISGEAQRETILKRHGRAKHACHPGCTIACSRVYVDSKGKYVTKGPEYETIWALGANCGIDDLDAIARMDRLCDDIGIDTIETGATIAVAMEGGLLKFGDAKGAIKLVREVGAGSPLGRIIGSGAKLAGQAFGVARVPVVKSQALPAYDPRAIKGIGVTYATSTMGADHTAGYSICQNVLKVGGSIDPLEPKGQVEISRNLQIATATIDSLGICLFVAFPVLDKPEAFQAMLDMTSAVTGKPFGADTFTEMGKSVLRTERDFNRRAGFTNMDDRLPDFFRTERLLPHDTVFDVPDAELDTVFNF
ncbi:MAG: aldehyde ferredoxin oxidoreductase C-terminal domain-containing protein [Planctomycetota bacterium]|nr:aldehyde ferredoxin oxidoreductase C-terminal domain-containing protein [Planctomycetota bacterium]